jgi:crotonobetainyl-CoA:carnitine CoA-transferase CaiB-like acyl-CoA transferase
MSSRPLDGVLVVSLEQAVAAPLATCRMADAGARVIKIERPEGDFARDYDRAGGVVSSYFAWLNRGKESLILDLKQPTDLALMRRILAKADVFVQNLAPGAVDRLGLGGEALRTARPELITCDISSYGPDGPFARRKGYDLLIQAESGLASVTGSPDAPGRIGVSVCDIATGMNAYTGVLEALIARGRTGVGASLHVSLFDAAAEWMATTLINYEASGRIPERIGLHHVGIAPYGVYAAGDGAAVLIAIQNEREWASLCRNVLGDEALVSDPRFADNHSRVRNRGELDAVIEACFARNSRPALGQLLDAAQIAYAGVNTVADLAAHPHLRRISVTAPGKSVSMPAPPVHSGALLAPGPVPALGAHSDAIRREFDEVV